MRVLLASATQVTPGIIFTFDAPTALQAVLAAARLEEKKQRAVLGFYLAALAFNLDKKASGIDPKKLAATLFQAAGNPKFASPVMTAIKKGTRPVALSIPVDQFSPDMAKLARAIMRTSSPQDKSYTDVARLAHLVSDQNVLKLWAPQSAKPKAGGDKKEYQKELGRHIKDEMIRLVREGKKPAEIVKLLDKEAGSNVFSKAIPPQLAKEITFTEQGGLLYKGEPLVSRGGGACTLWVLKGAKIQMPQRTGKEDSYVFAYIPAMGETAQKVYRKSSVDKANQKKWDVVGQLGSKINRIRAAWMKELKEESAIGAILQFAYITSARIGGLGNETDGQKTFGITTLQCRHVRWKGGTAIVEYPGKSGVVQRHVIPPNAETKDLLHFMKISMDNGDPNEELFTDDGTVFSSGEVNGFLQKYIKGLTIHKFRHLRGTQLAIQILEKLEVPEGVKQSAANSLFKKALEQVGAALGHYNTRGDDVKVTAATALKNYIDPQVCRDWFTEKGLDVPNFIPK